MLSRIQKEVVQKGKGKIVSVLNQVPRHDVSIA
jgi:hypothetical protein